MHHIHLTKSFVLSSFPFGEAGKVLNLLSKDFGVIRVNAQATRKSNSKLRQSIQNYSLTEVALVYGKKGWILTNARIIENSYYEIYNRDENNLGKIRTLTRIFSLIERMIPYEQKDDHTEGLFELIIKSIANLKECTPQEERAIETQAVYQIMDSLGYIGKNPLDDGLIKKDIEYVVKNQRKIIEIINNAIQESHL